MSNAPANHLNADQLDEGLVAYLDGELEPKAAQRIEDMLAGNEQARSRLSQLATSWDLLDQLPRATVDDIFTHTTVEMVALAAEKEVAKREAKAPAKRRLRWIGGLVATLAAAVVGFVAVALAVPDNNDALLRDLPVVQNLEWYRAVEDVDFLKLLAKEPFFTSDNADTAANGSTPGVAVTPSAGATNSAGAGASASPASARPGNTTQTGLSSLNLVQSVPESIDARRAWVESLSTNDKLDLRTNFEHFMAMSPKRQAELRQFDHQLRSDPQVDELSRVMDRYYEWIKTLSAPDRAELEEDTTAAKKIALVKQDQDRQVERTMSNRLSGNRQLLLKDPDSQAVLKWMSDFASRHRNQLIAAFPDDRKGDSQKGDDRRPRQPNAMAAYRLWWSPTASPDAFPPVTDEELRELRNALSKEKQAEFDAEPGLTGRVKLIRGWIQPAWQELREFAYQTAGRGSGGFVSTAERLKRFERTLPTEQRETLQKLPESERAAKLWELFQNARPDGFRGGPGGGGPGGGRGPRDFPPPGDGPRGPGGQGGPNGSLPPSGLTPND